MIEDIWIKQVELINFQSHKHTVIHFVKGLNVLVGDSNNGKTAVIRAIRWCLINEPDGTAFISSWADEATVKVVLSNGKTILRRRDRKNVNEYLLYEGDELMESFSGFGKRVPDAIKEAHGIQPIGDDIYFQIAEQTEGPFMMSLRPKQRAEMLGNLEELVRIDKALVDVNADVNAGNKNKKSLEKEQKKLKLDLEKKKLEIQRTEVKIATLKELKEGIESTLEVSNFLNIRMNRLYSIQEEMVEVIKDMQARDRLVAAWPDDTPELVQHYETLSKYINRLKELGIRLSQLRAIPTDKIQELDMKGKEIDSQLDHFQQLSRRLNELKVKEKTLSELDVHRYERAAELDFSMLDLELAKFQSVFKHARSLKRVDTDIQKQDQIIEQTNEELNKTLQQFVEKFHIAGFCPTCGQKTDSIEHKHAETILL